jgi:hypothetical protein
MTHPEINLSRASLFLRAKGTLITQKTLILLLISEIQRLSASTLALAGGAREIKFVVNYVVCFPYHSRATSPKSEGISENMCASWTCVPTTILFSKIPS